jgi:hypothetical protein
MDRTRGGYVMEQLLCEPIELTELELDAVSGGFTITIGASGSSVGVGVKIIVKNEPTTVIENYVDNNVSLSL